MPDLGKYAEAVLTSYAVSIALLITLVVLTIIKGRRARRALAEIESRGKKDA